MAGERLRLPAAPCCRQAVAPRAAASRGPRRSCTCWQPAGLLGCLLSRAGPAGAARRGLTCRYARAVGGAGGAARTPPSFAAPPLPPDTACRPQSALVGWFAAPSADGGRSHCLGRFELLSACEEERCSLYCCCRKRGRGAGVEVDGPGASRGIRGGFSHNGLADRAPKSTKCATALHGVVFTQLTGPFFRGIHRSLAARACAAHGRPRSTAIASFSALSPRPEKVASLACSNASRPTVSNRAGCNCNFRRPP